MKHVAQYGGLQSGGIGVYQHEKGSIRQKKGAALQEGENTVLNFPDLALGSSAVGGRIHDDRIVAAAPADLTLYELSAVIHKPADVCLAQTGELGIFSGPADHAFGGIHMRDFCTCGCGCGGCAAGIGEEIQDPDFFSGGGTSADELREPVPVDRLFGEKAGVFEAEGFEPEGQISVMDAPVIRKVKKLPFAAAFFAAVIVCVGTAPDPVTGRVPDYLGIGADQTVFTPSLQLSPFDVSRTS